MGNYLTQGLCAGIARLESLRIEREIDKHVLTQIERKVGRWKASVLLFSITSNTASLESLWSHFFHGKLYACEMEQINLNKKTYKMFI